MSSPRSDPGEPYARRWSRLWGMVTAAGVVLAMLEWSPVVVIVGVALDATCLVVGLLLLRTCLDRREADPGRGWVTRVGRRSTLVVCGVVAVSALVSASAPVGLLTVLAAAVSSPLAVHLMSERSLRTRTSRRPAAQTNLGPSPRKGTEEP